MELGEIRLRGLIEANEISIPVDIFYASRFSLYVNFNEEKNIRDGKRFNTLTIIENSKKLNLGVSRFYLDTNTKGYHGRLIFLDDLYNFDILFSKNELINLDQMSNDLNLLLNQKEKIENNFKNFILNLSYDLKIYKHHFDELDNLLQPEPEPSKSLVYQTLFNTEGRKFMDFFNYYLEKLKEEISNFSREDHEIHGFYLRRQLWDIIMCSEFMVRTNLKPRGYAGDSEMMRMIYDNNYKGDSTFNKLLHKISMEHPGAQAVRNRRLMVPKLLREVQKTSNPDTDSKFRFMSVACGPAYELQDVFITNTDIQKFECTLLDQDEHALNEAFKNIQNIEKMVGQKINVTLLKDSVRTMLKTKNLSDLWGEYDYIYSMGLFDYLTTPVATAVIEKLYSLLKPGGKILVGNFHYQNKSRWFMEYWHDWSLYYRSEEEFSAILNNTNAEHIKIMFEDTQTQMFLSACKPKKSN